MNTIFAIGILSAGFYLFLKWGKIFSHKKVL